MIAARPGESEPLEAGVSVVIPCYNCEKTIVQLVERLARVLPTCSERYEAILVNDQSPDGSWKAIEQLSRRFPFIVAVDLTRNYGQHNATLCGVRLARFDVTLTLDDDLQHPPEEIPKVLDRLAEGYGLVYGVPQKKTQNFLRSGLSWLIRFAIALASRQTTVQDLSAFRAFRTKVRHAFADYRSPQVILDILIAWGTTRIETVTVEHHERTIGSSNYRFRDLVRVALLMWTGYTTVPLRLASVIGFSFVAFGVGVLVYIVWLYFAYGTVAGFPFLASTIAIFGGVQLFTLGIMGEYLARIFNRSLDQPAYVVDRVVTANSGEDQREINSR